MTDIFDATILCKKCNVKMEQGILHKQGYDLRAVKCVKCNDKIIHPADLNEADKFKDLKNRNFSVKLRMVGNSHAISIPKEIVDFMNHQHRTMKKEMDDMVRLVFDDAETLRVRFGEEDR
jgi:hypothetical protein